MMNFLFRGFFLVSKIKKHFVILLLLTVIFIGLHFFQNYASSSPFFESSRQRENKLIEQIHARQLKAVQLLTERFAYKNWGLGQLGTRPFAECAEKRRHRGSLAEFTLYEIQA
jgi:hypothetical protein